jgi:S1-C subfamily serine protease
MHGKLRLLRRAALIAASLFVMAAPAAISQPKAEQGNGGASGSAAAQTQPGVLIVSVEAQSPAAQAGMTRGDVVLQADGKDLANPAALAAAVNAHKPGDALSLKIKHGDAEKTISVTLADKDGKPFLGVATSPFGWRMGRGMMARVLPRLSAGAAVVSVVSGGPAEKAGLKPNDVIESVDGVKINAQQDLKTIVNTHKVGDTVTLSVQTPGQQLRDVKVTLEKNPNADGPYLGIEYTPGVGPRMMQREPGMNGLEVNTGVLVRSVADNGPAAKAGFKPEDLIMAIDGVPVSTPNAVAGAVSNHKPGDTLTFKVWRMSEGKEYKLSATLDKTPQTAQGSTAQGEQGGAYLGITMSRFIGIEGQEKGTGFPLSPEMRGPGQTAPLVTTPQGQI